MAPQPDPSAFAPGSDILSEISVQPTPQRRTVASQFLPEEVEDYFRQQARLQSLAWHSPAQRRSLAPQTSCMLAELPPDDKRLKEIPRGCVPCQQGASTLTSHIHPATCA